MPGPIGLAGCGPTRREFNLLMVRMVSSMGRGQFRVPVTQSTDFQWQTLKVGGGGFTRDMDIAPDGTKVCKIDVFGAYVWNNEVTSPGNAGGVGAWQQLCAPDRIPAGDPAYTTARTQTYYANGGAWDVRIAPSNSSVIYMVWSGMMYKSTNRGKSFVNQTNNAGGTFPLRTSTNGGPNTSAGGAGPPMAIDPQNPNVCWVGDFGGVFFTADGGANWSTLSTAKLPLPTGTYSYGFAFDPVSAVSGGKTQGIYASVDGTGVYYSSDAGTNWTLLSGGSFSGVMPTSIVRLVVDKFGVAWVCRPVASPNLYNFTVQSGTAFTANTWTLSSAATTNPTWSVAPDPASTSSATQRVIISGYAGDLAQTTNGGTTWTPVQALTFNQVATDIPWLQTNELSMSLNGCMKFDPSQSNALYFPEGVGIWYANLPTVGDSSTWPAWSWISQTAGIESLETAQIISPPGGPLGLVQWDRNWFTISDRTRFPTIYGTWPGNRANNNTNQSVIWHGHGADWAGQNPSFVALHCGGAGQSTAGQQVGPGYSTTYGAPAVTGWSFFANQPSGPVTGSGASPIAVSTSTSMMAIGLAKIWGTTDGGATAWVDRTPAATTWTNGFAQTDQSLAADKVTANYYVACNGSNIYYTSNTGSSWTTVTPGFSFGSATGGVQVKAIPNNAGHFFLTAGASFGATVDASNIFYRTSNGGQTWADVSQVGYTVREVWVWGYGAAVGSYPTIFIYGYVNSVLGVWKSIDNCVSWQQIGDARFGGKSFDLPNCMAGDMNIVGNVYVGFLGSGYLQYSR